MFSHACYVRLRIWHTRVSGCAQIKKHLEGIAQIVGKTSHFDGSLLHCVCVRLRRMAQSLSIRPLAVGPSGVIKGRKKWTKIVEM